jgi:hypothetical protein
LNRIGALAQGINFGKQSLQSLEKNAPTRGNTTKREVGGMLVLFTRPVTSLRCLYAMVTGGVAPRR